MAKRWQFLFVVLVVVLALASMAVRFHASHANDDLFFNSDALYLPTLFADVLGSSGALDHWYLTPAPYFFPDYALFLIAYLLVPSPFLQISVFLLLQVSLTLVLLVWLARRMEVSAPWSTAVLIWLCLCWLAWSAGEPFIFLLVSGFHFGAFLSAIAFVALWLSHLQSHASWRSPWLWLTCLLAAVTTLSDQLFLLQTVAPFLATVALLAAVEGTRNRTHALQALVVSASAWAGSLAYPLLVNHQMRYPVQLGLGQWARNWKLLTHLLTDLATRHLAYTLLLIAFLLVTLTTLARWRRRAVRGSQDPGLWIVLFVPLSLAAACVVTLLHEGSPTTLRYWIPIALWPVVAATFVLARRFARGLVVASSLLSLILLVALLSQAYAQARSHGLRLRQYPDDVACMDRALDGTNAQRGIAEYWDAKRVQGLSRHHLQIAQHFDTLEPMRWITTEDTFAERYDFAIVSRREDGTLSPMLERLREINPAPLQRVTCGKHTLLVYGHQQLRTRAHLQLPGDSKRWRACELPTNIGAPTPACELVKRAPALQGFLSYGPYVTLPAGNYRASVQYASQGGPGTRVGHWDVAVTVAGRLKVLTAPSLPGTDSLPSQATTRFKISQSQAAGLVEVRTFAESSGDLRIDVVEIERVH